MLTSNLLIKFLDVVVERKERRERAREGERERGREREGKRERAYVMVLVQYCET